jgi:hypothetical protein
MFSCVFANDGQLDCQPFWNYCMFLVEMNRISAPLALTKKMVKYLTV